MPPGPKNKPAPDGWLLMGRVSGVFGIRGEVRLFLYNRESTLFDEPRQVRLRLPDGSVQQVRLTSRPGAGKRVLGRIDGVSTPEAARALIGAELMVPESALPPLEEDTYYHHQLIGLPVYGASGRLLGTLQEIAKTGNVDLWVVRSDDEELYIPAVGDEIISVDIGDRVVVAD